MRYAIWLSLFVTAVAGCDAPDESGPNGAFADATMPDATMPDATMPDAAFPDATLPDFAMPDAAMPDAAMPDAATPDAAMPDAAPLDAAPPDAALVCPTPGPEVCNGVDDDCDDAIDEGIEPMPCETGQPGVCAAGTAACVDGAIVCAPDTAPGDELCDALDNDCDGAADEPSEPCYTGSPESRGLGLCRDGLLDCVDGACLGEVVPPAGLALEERRVPLGRRCFAVMVADLNADGALDIVCHHPLAVLVNDGAGGFGPPVELGVDGPFESLQRLAAADVDLDGTVDVVVATQRRLMVVADPLGAAPRPVEVPRLLTQPDGAQGPFERAFGLAVADLTGDGAPDIAFMAEVDGWLVLALAVNEGGGVFAGARALGPLPQSVGSVSTVDVDGDGVLDLIAATGGGVAFARGGPEGPGDAAPIEQAPAGVHGVADVTGDGHLDLVGGNGRVIWRARFEAGPALVDPVSTLIPPDITEIGIAQLDCDPEMEAVVISIDIFDGCFIHAFMDGDTLAHPIRLPCESSDHSMAIGDVDGDGMDDIVIGAEDGVRMYRRVP